MRIVPYKWKYLAYAQPNSEDVPSECEFLSLYFF